MGKNIEGGEISVSRTQRKNTGLREGFSQLKGAGMAGKGIP